MAIRKPSESLGKLERLEMELAAMLECQDTYYGTLFGWWLMWEQTDLDLYIDRERSKKNRIHDPVPIPIPGDYVGKLYDRIEAREHGGLRKEWWKRK